MTIKTDEEIAEKTDQGTDVQIGAATEFADGDQVGEQPEDWLDTPGDGGGSGDEPDLIEVQSELFAEDEGGGDTGETC